MHIDLKTVMPYVVPMVSLIGLAFVAYDQIGDNTKLIDGNTEEIDDLREAYGGKITEVLQELSRATAQREEMMRMLERLQ